MLFEIVHSFLSFDCVLIQGVADTRCGRMDRIASNRTFWICLTITLKYQALLVVKQFRIEVVVIFFEDFELVKNLVGGN